MFPDWGGAGNETSSRQALLGCDFTSHMHGVDTLLANSSQISAATHKTTVRVSMKTNTQCLG